MATTYVSKVNNTEIFAKRAEYTKGGKELDTTLDSKISKVTSATSGNLAVFDSSGSLVDSNQSVTGIVHDASYVHTDNNFTTSLKDKLDSIASGAEVNVQSDWNQTTITADDYIKNKPENLVQDASYVHTDNNFTTSLKDKLDSIALSAQVNVIETIKVNGSNQIVTDKAVDITVPVAGTGTPIMDGTASTGTENTWSRSDHVHPTDTTREATANKDSSIPSSPIAGHYPSTEAVVSFVNSSISTNTANFLGTKDVVTDLGLTTSATNNQIAAALGSYTWPAGVAPTNNDYVFVSINLATTTDVDEYRRFKYTEGTPNGSWAYEYTLNNSSFTQAQWDSINSTITTTKVGSYDSHLSDTNNPHSVTKDQIGLSAVGNFLAVSTEANQGLDSTKQSNARTNIGAGTYSKDANGIPKTDLASGVQTSLGLADTALQSSDVDSAMSSTSTNPVQNKVVNSALEGKASSTHTHGNIQNGGTLQTSDVIIASGDKLVITDSSDSNKVARASAAFDGSTVTKALTQKGTFETFLTSHQDISGKADKVSSATNGNFAGLDSNGNLTDSGKKASDFATSAQGTAASTAVQSVKIGSSSGTELKSGTSVIIPSASTSAYGVITFTTIEL